MYDTVTFTLGQDQCPGVNLIETVPNYLIDTRQTTYENGNVSISGRVGSSLHFSVSQNTLKLNKGSLAKYFLDDNINTLTRGDTERACEKLSDHFHIDIGPARIIRLDVANNIITMNPESMYFRCLGDRDYFKRLELDNGLYYQNYKEELLFYGKLAEQKEKGNRVPEWLAGRYMLRYEMRLLNRLAKQLKENITLSNIHEESFYMKVLDKYIAEYHKINKLRAMTNSMRPGTPKEVLPQIAAMIIGELGIDHFNKKFDEWRSQNIINRKTKSDLKKMVRSLAKACPAGEENDLIRELDQKIEEAVKYYR